MTSTRIPPRIIPPPILRSPDAPREPAPPEATLPLPLSLEETAKVLGGPARWEEFKAFVPAEEAVRPTVLTPAAEGEVTVLHWSLENLFDPVDDPAKQDEQFTHATGYTDAQAERHLQNYASVVSKLHPDIFTATEIENAGRADALRDALNARYALDGSGLKMNVVHAESNDERGIDQALYTKYPVVGQSYHDFAVPSGGATRGVLQADLQLDDNSILTVLVVHAPSMRGGDAATLDRQAIFSQTRALMDKLIKEGRQVMLTGDFNESPGGSSTGSMGLDATLSPTEARDPHKRKPLSTMGLLLAEKGHRGNPKPDDGMQSGTHYYGVGRAPGWSLFDNIVVSPDFVDENGAGLRLVPGWPQVVDLPELMDGNVPDRFFDRDDRPESGEGGYSDHLPVMIRLASHKP